MASDFPSVDGVVQAHHDLVGTGGVRLHRVGRGGVQNGLPLFREDDAVGAVDSLASKIKSGFSFGVLTGMGQKAFSAISSGVNGLFGEINSSNAAWKTFAGNMQIIGKNEGEITAVKKELQRFAEQTVYNSSDMAQTYAQLAAVGTKNTAKLVKGFGGLAAAAENPQIAISVVLEGGYSGSSAQYTAKAVFDAFFE